MSVAEHGAKVATGIVDGLKSQPISLALIVLNLVFIGFVGWIAHEINLRTEHQYQVKDQLIASVIGTLQGTVEQLRTEVRANTDRTLANAQVAEKVSDALARIARLQEDFDRRLREQEKR